MERSPRCMAVQTNCGIISPLSGIDEIMIGRQEFDQHAGRNVNAVGDIMGLLWFRNIATKIRNLGQKITPH
jgi:hypothetical protein